jgi:TetR/AcrR family transcriptional regulator, cholesterol catabolism regulator
MNEELSSILEKVNELYKKYGIKSVTMDDVARELGMSKKTLYQQVKDKNELVEQVIKFDGLKKKEATKNITEDPNINAIEQLFGIYKFVQQLIREHSPTVEYDLKKYYPALYSEMHEKKREGMYENMLNNMKKGKKEKLYRKALNEEIIAHLHVLRVESILNADFGEQNFDAFDFFTEVFEYHLHGVANEAGLKIYYELKKKYKNEHL